MPELRPVLDRITIFANNSYYFYALESSSVESARKALVEILMHDEQLDREKLIKKIKDRLKAQKISVTNDEIV